MRTSGREAKRSERYTPLIVKRLVAGLLAPSIRRAIAERSRDVLENDVPDEPASGHQLLLAVKTLHSNLGHPGLRALARAIRLSGGSDEAVSAALANKCPSCARLREPKPVNPARLNDRWRDFGDLVCVELFNLADLRGNNQMFLTAVDKASGYQLVAPVDNKRPDIILHAFMQLWFVPLGVPYNILSDSGGEFDAEFSEELESMGARILRSASYAPTQNATCERRGGAWKAHACALMDEHSITFDDPMRIFLLCASINHAVNTMVENHGYAPAQWVLGKNPRLPYALLSQSGQLAALTRLGSDPAFAERVMPLAAARRSVAALSANVGIARAFAARSRGEASVPAITVYQVGDQDHGHQSLSPSQRHVPPRLQAPRVKTSGGELHNR